MSTIVTIGTEGVCREEREDREVKWGWLRSGDMWASDDDARRPVEELQPIRLNGWQRIWVVLTMIWCLLAGAIFIGTAPSSSNYDYIADRMLDGEADYDRYWEYEARLPQGSVALAISDAKLSTRTGTDIAAYIKRTNPEFYRDVVIAIRAVEEEELKRARREHINVAALVLAIPPGLLYLLGLSIAWIRRGFQGA